MDHSNRVGYPWDEAAAVRKTISVSGGKRVSTERWAAEKAEEGRE